MTNGQLITLIASLAVCVYVTGLVPGVAFGSDRWSDEAEPAPGMKENALKVVEIFLATPEAFGGAGPTVLDLSRSTKWDPKLSVPDALMTRKGSPWDLFGTPFGHHLDPLFWTQPRAKGSNLPVISRKGGVERHSCKPSVFGRDSSEAFVQAGLNLAAVSRAGCGGFTVRASVRWDGDSLTRASGPRPATRRRRVLLKPPPLAKYCRGPRAPRVCHALLERRDSGTM